VTFSPGLDVPPASGQQTLISLVVQNLLANAEKYSPPETAIQVSLRRNEAGLPEVSIRDNGIGMEPDDLEEIFTPFYRSQRARAIAKGMGIGLAVCKRIVEAHGGTIEVNSQPDQGSEFIFSLRRAQLEEPAPF
jgi:signal transduction histidine kinase